MKQERILSIKELNRYIKMKLETDATLQDVWIRGEISNFTRHSSGHMYFTLKDADSRVKAIMFASHNQKLAFLPREGMLVLARGNISIYERDGQYQFYVTMMQPDGIGSLYLAYEQLKAKLEAEGLFRKELKKPIPRFPVAIGVVTSPTGAAIRDIITTLQRRYPGAAIVLHPVLVQGTQAAASIAAAIRTMNERNEVDVLIVGRGGGSLEELWAFNEEVVARSIHSSRIPIISAVGHETDFTIADFVADLRAATPTAAAELAVPHYLELKQQLYYYSQRVSQGLLAQMRLKQERLVRMQRSQIFINPHKFFLQPAERLDRLKEQLNFRLQRMTARSRDKLAKLQHSLSGLSPKEQLIYARTRLERSGYRLQHAMQGLNKEKKQALLSRIRQLDALSPLKVMQRGYSLVYDQQEQRIIRSIRQVSPSDVVKIRLSDGKMDCLVWSMEEEGDGNGTTNA